MRFSGVLLAMMVSAGPEVSIFDSKTAMGKSWILVDDCAAEVNTFDIKTNPDKVVQQVMDFCKIPKFKLDYETQEKRKTFN